MTVDVDAPVQNRVVCNLVNAALKDYYFHFGDDREKMSELVRACSCALQCGCKL